VAKALQDAGAAVVAVEPNPSAVHRAYERGVKECICGLYEEIQLPSGSVPAIGCFDVIEHVESPETLLEEFHRTLAVGGVLLLSVPALRILWSQSDEYAGHYRRYSRATLDRLLVSCGFRPIKVKYVFAFLLPAIFFLRVLPWRLGIHFERTQLHDRSLRQLSPGIFGRVMGILLRVEHRIGALVNLPFGTSLVAAYRKV
jgi:SAM-dependent methyltransferase